MDLDFQPENLPPSAKSFTPNRDGAGPANQPPTQPIPATTGSPPPPPPPTPVSSTPLVPVPPAPRTTNQSFAPKNSSRKILLIILIIALLIGLAAIVYFVVIPTFFSSQPEQTSPATTTETSTTPQTSTTLPGTTTVAGRDAIRKQDLKKIATLLDAYFTDNQLYPIAPTKEKLNISNNIAVQSLVPKYAATLPVDPLDPELWYGYESKDGKSYELTARLEDPTDSEAQLVGSKFLYFIKK